MRSTVVIASLAASAAATFKATSHFDRFDSANPAQGLLPVASPVDGNEPGSGLYYGGWVYSNLVATEATLTPPSPNNIITTGTATQVLDGRPRFLPLNKTVAFFDETSIYYACFVQSEAPTAVTTPCTIQAAGVKKNGGGTVVQEFVYNPSALPVGQHFNFGVFEPSFKGLSRVDFSLTSATGAENLVLPGFDSHRYVTYKEAGKA